MKACTLVRATPGPQFLRGSHASSTQVLKHHTSAHGVSCRNGCWFRLCELRGRCRLLRRQRREGVRRCAHVSRLTCPIDPRVGRVRIDECKVGDDADSHQTVRCADGPIHLLAEGCGPGKMTEGSGCILFVMMQHSFHSNPPLIAPIPTILSSQ